MSNSMRDYERKQFEDKMSQEAKRQNDLLATQIAQTERYREDQKKQAFEDRIYQLRLAVAQTKLFFRDTLNY